MAALADTSADALRPPGVSDVDARLIAGRFRLLEPLGRGGMGRVFRARDELLHRPVAIKLIYDDSIADSDLRHACALEARAAARLHHPGIVRILDSGFDDGHLYVVMSLAEGHTLAERLRADGPLPPYQALDVASQVADALQAAHLEGIIHCDVKPSNLIVRSDGRVQLVDFGIARIAASTTNLDSASLQGSAEYVAPEQVEGGHVDARTDLYALGVVLFEMLTGRTPFGGGTLAAVLARRLVAEPPSVRATHPQLPHAVDQVVKSLLARDPAERFQAATDACAALVSAQRSVLTDGLPKPPMGQFTSTMPLGAARQFGTGRCRFGMGMGMAPSRDSAAERDVMHRAALALWGMAATIGPCWRASVHHLEALARPIGRRISTRSASRTFLAVGVAVAALLGFLIGTLAASGQEQAKASRAEVAGVATPAVPSTAQPPTPLPTSPPTVVPTPTTPPPTATVAEPPATPLPATPPAPEASGVVPSTENSTPADIAPSRGDSAPAPPARVLAAPVPQPEPPTAKPAPAKPAAKPEEKKPSSPGPSAHGNGNPKPSPENGHGNGNGQKKR